MAEGSRTNNYHNTGHTQIGAQGGDVHGDVRFGAPPEVSGTARSLQQQIDELSAALIAARTAGHIDDATLAEASAALEDAHEHAATTDGGGRDAVIRALRRAKGLVEEAGGLVAAIGAVIAAVSAIR